jgi:hypothetical protein
MVLSAQQGEHTGGVFLMMEPGSTPKDQQEEQVNDCATLYLCRQGPRWVVILESPRVRSALRLRHAGHDSFDARFELLSKARRACPDASILSADGALEDADYEWRLEVRALQPHFGDLGVALHQILSPQPKGHRRRLSGKTERRHCLRGRRSVVVCRPRTF